MAERDGVEIRSERGVVHLTIDTGTDENRLSPAAVSVMTDVFSDPPRGARVARISARGPAFCLGPQPPTGGRTVRELGADLLAFNRALVVSDLVTVAEVGAPAAGFGVGVACLPDVTIAGKSATFVLPEVRQDLSPALVLSWLPEVVGQKTATWLALSGRPLGASAAATLGLVSLTVSDADLVAEVDAVIEEMLGMNDETVREIKRFLRDRRGLLRHGAEELAIERMGRWAERRRTGD